MFQPCACAWCCNTKTSASSVLLTASLVLRSVFLFCHSCAYTWSCCHSILTRAHSAWLKSDLKRSHTFKSVSTTPVGAPKSDEASRAVSNLLILPSSLLRSESCMGRVWWLSASCRGNPRSFTGAVHVFGTFFVQSWCECAAGPFGFSATERKSSSQHDVRRLLSFANSVRHTTYWSTLAENAQELTVSHIVKLLGGFSKPPRE